MSTSLTFDVIVVGAGHAGCEASLACARLGCYTLLLTMDPETVAKMSCNPAVGGLAKGHLVREIDALGGEMAKATDETSIQSRVLNRTQGPAVWGLRAQCDKELYNLRMRRTVQAQSGLEIEKGMAVRLLIENNKACGVITQEKKEIRSRAVILTTGTFLNGLMHVGEVKTKGGRAGEPAAEGLSDHLRELGFEVGRFKTGTNPRVKKDSIDFTKTQSQKGDASPVPFSYFTQRFPIQPQVACYITHTNEKTHDVIRKNLDRSPLYSGTIQGIGPRYCPSIEDKVVKFPERTRHQVFLEPEGLSTDEFYLNGLSTSLPLDVQNAYLHTIPGLENAVIARPGYAVEYDMVPPTQILHTLETRQIQNLFLAGQINGTSGYEEASAQGLMAGLNAVAKVQGKPPFVLSRSEAYIGVLIDDLVTKGTEEPYRLFTSSAEYRLLLRPDNADIRLMEKGYDLGLIPSEARDQVVEKKRLIELGLKGFRETLLPHEATPQESLKLTVHDRGSTLEDILRRPGIHYEDLRPFLAPALLFDREIAFQIEVEIKYEGYLKRQRMDIDRKERTEKTPIPKDFPYESILSFSREARDKLARIRPETIDQASRIPGVTPADITVLILALARMTREKQKSSFTGTQNP